MLVVKKAADAPVPTTAAQLDAAYARIARKSVLRLTMRSPFSS
jgi:hypothetical protein